jgi:arylformamidase
MDIAELVDLTAPIYHNCPGNPSLPLTTVDLVMNRATSDFRLERLEMRTHSGTHVDAPSHALDDGAALDDIPLSRFMGQATFLDLRDLGPRGAITAAHLEAHADRIAGCSFVVLYTGWGEKVGFTKEFMLEAPFLDPSGAAWLVEHQLGGLGIDHCSVSGSEEENDLAVHRTLLSAGILIVESLVLTPRLLERETWYLIVLPLRIQGASGAPARAVALAWEG